MNKEKAKKSFKKLCHFVAYNNTFIIAISLIFIGNVFVFAASSNSDSEQASVQYSIPLASSISGQSANPVVSSNSQTNNPSAGQVQGVFNPSSSPVPSEILGKRTQNSKTYDLGNDKYISQFHAGHIHFKDSQGDFQEVDLTFEDKGAYWQVTKASFRLYIAKDFGASQLIRFDNRYEGANHTIYYEPHSIWWVNADNTNERTKVRDAQSVTGVLTDNVIRWTNAFGNGAHFEVTLMRSGFKKEIVIDQQPQNPPYTNYYVVPVFKWSGNNLKIKHTGGADWDENSFYDSNERFEIREISSGLKSYIQQAYGVDSQQPIPNRRSLRVFFEERDGNLWQGKLITKAMIENAVYPIRADTITTYYSGAGDGRVFQANPDWDAIHHATSGTANYTESGINALRAYVRTIGGPNYNFVRSFIPIDTSAIPANAIISAATLNLYTTSGSTETSGNDWVVVLQTDQPDETILGNVDFNNCGAVHTPTEGSDRVDVSDIPNNQYNVWTLDATGRGWIKKSGEASNCGSTNGFTCLGIRAGHDVLDIETNLATELTASSSETAAACPGASCEDPYLSVTYTVPQSKPPGPGLGGFLRF